MTIELFTGTKGIHVWSAFLDADDAKIPGYASLLSPDEAERASRFHFEKDRNHFIVCRGLLRILLGSYSRQEPADIQFRYNEFGKPSMIAPDKTASTLFNLSHSRGKALLAFSKNIPLGIDLEGMRGNLDFASMAKRFFSPAEISAFFSLPEEFWQEAFFNCWTRKEAFLKAKEKGLSLGLDQFDVSLRPGEPARLLRTAYEESDARLWSLHDLNAGPGYKAALAAKSKKPDISYHHWKAELLP